MTIGDSSFDKSVDFSLEDEGVDFIVSSLFFYGDWDSYFSDRFKGDSDVLGIIVVSSSVAGNLFYCVGEELSLIVDSDVLDVSFEPFGVSLESGAGDVATWIFLTEALASVMLLESTGFVFHVQLDVVRRVGRHNGLVIFLKC